MARLRFDGAKSLHLIQHLVGSQNVQREKGWISPWRDSVKDQVWNQKSVVFPRWSTRYHKKKIKVLLQNQTYVKPEYWHTVQSKEIVAGNHGKQDLWHVPNLFILLSPWSCFFLERDTSQHVFLKSTCQPKNVGRQTWGSFSSSTGPTPAIEVGFFRSSSSLPLFLQCRKTKDRNPIPPTLNTHKKPWFS